MCFCRVIIVIIHIMMLLLKTPQPNILKEMMIIWIFMEMMIMLMTINTSTSAHLYFPYPKGDKFTSIIISLDLSLSGHHFFRLLLSLYLVSLIHPEMMMMIQHNNRQGKDSRIHYSNDLFFSSPLPVFMIINK